MVRKNLAGFYPNPQNDPPPISTSRDYAAETAYQSISMAVKLAPPKGPSCIYFVPGISPLDIGMKNLEFYTSYVGEYQFLPNNRELWTGMELAGLIRRMVEQLALLADPAQKGKAKKLVAQYKKLYFQLTKTRYSAATPYL